MSSGYRRNLMEFEKWTEGYDASGWPINQWQSYAPELKAWGRFKPLRGDGYWASQQVQSDVIGEIEIPFIPLIVRELHDDLSVIRIKMCMGVASVPPGTALFRYFKIESFHDPDERRKRIILMVKEEVL